MPYTCQLVQFLRRIETASEHEHFVGLSYIARVALKIVKDIEEEHIGDFDIVCLADLVKEITQETNSDLLAYLKNDALDCGICAALAVKLGLQT